MTKMKIIGIYKRRKSLYGVELDIGVNPKNYGAEADPTGLIALDITVCDEKGLKVGTELDEDKLLNLVNESHFARAKRRALWYLERGDLSKKQLIEKLSRAFPKEIAERVAERFIELSLIDDERYAARLAERLVFDKKMSPKYAAFLMANKGIDRATAQSFTENLEADSLALIREIIERRYKNRLNDEKEINRAIGYLSRRGFEFSDIKKVLREYNDRES